MLFGVLLVNFRNYFEFFFSYVEEILVFVKFIIS